MALCTFMVGQGLNSGTSVYLETLGESSALAGILAGVFSAAAGAARIISGPIIDSKGRVLVMITGGAILLVGTILPVLFSGIALFTTCRVLQGVGFSAATSAAATAAADVLPKSRLGEGIGYYGLGQALAMSVGPALALFLVNTEPPENLYLGLSAISALALIFTALCRYEKRPERLPETAGYRLRCLESGETGESTGTRAAASDAGAAEAAPSISIAKCVQLALPGSLPMLVLSPAFGFGIFFVGVYGQHLGVESQGLFFTFSAFAMIVVRLSSQWFMDRIPPRRIAIAYVVFGVLAFVMLLANDGQEILFYLAGIPYGVCLGVSTPLNQSIVVKATPQERLGVASSIYLLAVDIGIGVSSAIWGFVNDMAGFEVTICCVIGCILVSLVLSLILYPRRKRA